MRIVTKRTNGNSLAKKPRRAEIQCLQETGATEPCHSSFQRPGSRQNLEVQVFVRYL